ncbi:hypothetical protein [Paraburkholderia bonniea]|uniref:hypothetical protein n=1 Tax=Paraburkholderia bonniea TaxID=2152891 RepID=UPI001FE8B65A|nr:hypothetical protein [Paraburkholderia bonniea]
MKKYFLPLLCILAASCSTRGQLDPDVMQIASAPLTCANPAECTEWWGRAQTWITQHSRYPVEISNDSLIQTAAPDGGKRALAYQITRSPNPDGSATLDFAAHCDSTLGCRPNPWQAGADFKAFVRGMSNQAPAPAAPEAALPASTIR